MANVEVQNLAKSFDAVEVIPELSLVVPDSSFTVLVGPSGCGKSTLLRLIAGLEDVSQGSIFIDDIDVTWVQPSKRGVAMVFQSYALYPHMSVRENMSFALRLAKLDKAVIDKKVEDAADTLQMRDLLDRMPKELSGGQRQRVAIGRAIVRKPKVFLFDEPLSNLDAALRGQMRVELARLHKRLAATMIYVTHDQVEAMTMADHIVVMKDGVIQQTGAPLDIYNAPINKFVAGFIGSPKMNFLQGEVAAAHKAHSIGVRPEHLKLSKTDGDWQGVVSMSERLGSDTFVSIELGDIGLLVARVVGDFKVQTGDSVFVTPVDGFVHCFDKQGQTVSAS